MVETTPLTDTSRADQSSPTPSPAPNQWWRDSTVYQIYPRSFADHNGDGTGDIEGIRDQLPYLAGLGIDAVWITPWYPSPMADGGYDVSDYRDIAPEFGDLEHARAMIDDAHSHGIKVILDIVPNHTSDQHPWFQAALKEGLGSPFRDRFHFAKGKGPNGELPPNDWQSQFGGIAWTRLPDGDWYLHQFDASQPDLNWDSPEVREDFRNTLRFWFDLGVDGFRIDVATALVKAPGLPDLGFTEDAFLAEVRMDNHPYRDRDELHDIYRDWRRIADSYPEPKLLIAEAWLERPHRLSRYLRPDELHMAFNVPFLGAGWEAVALAQAIDDAMATVEPVGATPNWVVENHDTDRVVTRYGRVDTRKQRGVDPESLGPADEALGLRRARAVATLMLALPGCVFVYQGQELGLPTAFVPDEALQDPIWERSGHTRRGRDGARVPLPWNEDPSDGFGFGSDAPWLPQPEGWGSLSVETQSKDETSTLSLYRQLIELRRGQDWGELRAIDVDGPILLVRRGERLICVVNTGSDEILVPRRTLVGGTRGEARPDDFVVHATSTVDGASMSQEGLTIASDTAVLLEAEFNEAG